MRFILRSYLRWKKFFIGNFRLISIYFYPSTLLYLDIITNHQWVVGVQNTSTSSVQKLRENFSCHVISHLIPGKPTTTTHLSKLFSSIPILFFIWLCKNTSSCQLSAFSYQRETWSFFQFFKKKSPIFQQKFFCSIFSDFVEKRDSTLFV